MESGIYHIVNIITGDEYIGSSSNSKKRKGEHFSLLRHENHYNSYLQRAFSKYGEDSFRFELLEIVGDIDKLFLREQWWIDVFNPVYNATNIAGARFNYGKQQSPETRRKLAIARKKAWTPEKRQAFSNSLIGNTYNLGKSLSEDTKRKIGKANSIALKGKKQSKQTRLKRSKALSGKNNPLYGKKQPKEVRDKIAKTQRPIPLYFISPDGDLYEVYNLSRFCEKHNLSYKGMRLLANGKLKKGYHRQWELFIVS